MFRKIQNIHFVGIGGIGMSGIAQLLYNLGYKISGSDIVKSDRTKLLNEMGIQVMYGHNEKNINGAQVVVFSSAVNYDNPEIIAANSIGELHVKNFDGNDYNNFPINYQFGTNSAPIIDDIDLDSDLELIIGMTGGSLW